MDTKLLREKIDRFGELLKNGKLNIPMAKELVTDLNTWMDAIDSKLGSYEFDQLVEGAKMNELNETIQYLVKTIILLGGASVLTVLSIVDKAEGRESIDFLFNNKDRFNISNLYHVGKLLKMIRDDGKEAKTLTDIVNYARTGEI